MNREKQLAFCKRCEIQGFSPEVGIICSLTNKPAAFEDNCKDFKEKEITSAQLSFEADASMDYRASNGTRFVNYLIDYILKIVIITFVGVLLSFAGLSEFVLMLNGYLFAFIVIIIYYVFFESVFKQTPGKMITGTMVVKNDGSDIKSGDAFLRTLSRFVPFEPFSFLGDDAGWHDQWTKTSVVKKREWENRDKSELL